MNKSQPSQPQQQNPQISPKPTNNVLDQQKTSTPKPDNFITTAATVAAASATATAATNNNNIMKKNNKVIWDCGSTLYDSFELNSFRKQLDSAIINSSRTLSMPRLPSEDHRAPPPPQPQPQPQLSKKPTSSKLSRSFQKLLRSVFRATKPNKNTQKPNSGDTSPDPWFFDSPGSYEDKAHIGGEKGDKYYAVYEKPNINGLTTIPEIPEVTVSPEIGSFVRKTMSDRFTSASHGIYCA